MNKNILTISIIILLSVNIISASWVSDTWQKITGDAVTGYASGNPSCGTLGASKGYAQTQLRCESAGCSSSHTNLGKTYDCNYCCAAGKSPQSASTQTDTPESTVSNCPNGFFSVIRKALMYDSAGQKLLDKGKYKGISIIIRDQIISSWNGASIAGRLIDLDPKGCNANILANYGIKTKPCINLVIEIAPKKQIENFKRKAWITPRILSDGSKVTAYPKDFFKNYGEYIRWGLEHEYQHTLIAKKTSETIGQYEDRINKKADEELIKVRAAYEKNCVYI